MGKVQILAVLTMDGCLSSELYDKAHQDLCLDRCGLDEIREKALYHVTPDYSISMLHEWRKDGTNIRYLAEATPDTSDYINGLLRMHAVDEISDDRLFHLCREMLYLGEYEVVEYLLMVCISVCSSSPFSFSSSPN